MKVFEHFSQIVSLQIQGREPCFFYFVAEEKEVVPEEFILTNDDHVLPLLFVEVLLIHAEMEKAWADERNNLFD
ncbi:MAG: hypothetical protein ACK5LK_07705 [Chthoniobacterales bacterium]